MEREGGGRTFIQEFVILGRSLSGSAEGSTARREPGYVCRAWGLSPGDPTQGAQPWGILEAVSMSISIVMLTACAQGLKFL